MNTLTLLSDSLLQELRVDVFKSAISLMDFDYLVQIDNEIKRRAQSQVEYEKMLERCERAAQESPIEPEPLQESPIAAIAFWRVALPILRERE